MEVNYNVVDGCVNLQRDNSGKAFLDAEKQPKKQIAIVKRTGRQVPKYLKQQMVKEKI